MHSQGTISPLKMENPCYVQSINCNFTFLWLCRLFWKRVTHKNTTYTFVRHAQENDKLKTHRRYVQKSCENTRRPRDPREQCWCHQRRRFWESCRRKRGKQNIQQSLDVRTCVILNIIRVDKLSQKSRHRERNADG